MNSDDLVPNHRAIATIWYQAGGVVPKSTQEALQDKNR